MKEKLKIALLVCDDSNTSFEHNSGSYVDMFTRLFNPSLTEVAPHTSVSKTPGQSREFQELQNKKCNANRNVDSNIDYQTDCKFNQNRDHNKEKKKEKFELTPFDVRINEYPDDLNVFDGYLTTGSAHSVYENLPWIQDLKKFIRKLYENNQKYFGICFGHQLIAESLGGKVEKSDEGWIVGVKQTEIIKPQPWMTPGQSSCIAISSHLDQIVKLPPDAEVIAYSQGCPKSMIQVGENFVGFQGHPEFTKDYALPLMLSRRNQMSEETIKVATRSFTILPDPDLLRSWMINFFSE